MSIADLDIEFHPACAGCDRVLTDEERRFYGEFCESCERNGWEHLRTWLAGRRDADLDALTSDKSTVH